MKQALKLPPVLYDVISCRGGMDEKTPTLELPSGSPRDALNFECSIRGGYTRIQGYERFDGHALPSSVAYSLVYLNSFVTVPAAGDTISGLTSGATGYVLASGTNYVVITEVVGVFQVGETIKDGAATVGKKITPTGVVSAINDATYAGLAADRQRTHIAAVPGSGDVRGVFVYNDVVYAFRDNGAVSVLYKATAAGWTAIPFFYELGFNTGNGLPAEGSTVTQGGVTAIIKRIVLESGAWTGNAAGRFIVSATAGGNFGAGAASAPGSTFTLIAQQSAITMTAGGTFDFCVGNFSGGASTIRAYGCDGVNRCFEFDGTILVPITTGDTPNHILIHKNFLWTAAGAMLSFSAPGLPYDHTVADGAGQIGASDNITDMLELPGAQTTATMGVWTRRDTRILYGTTAATFNLVPLNTGCGCMPFMAQNMAHTYVTDDRGVIDIETTLAFGNFESNTATFKVNNFIANKRSRLRGSALSRLKSQYRIFCSDGFGLYVTSLQGDNAAYSGAMPVYFPNPVTCIYNDKLSNGDEVCYFGSTNGFVYKLDSGTSFDGVAINYALVFGYNSIGSPRMLKRFRHAEVDISSTAFCQFQFGYTLGYGVPGIMQSNSVSYQTNNILPAWDAFTWDAFTWDGTNIVPSECDMVGTAENYAVAIRGSSAISAAFNINNIVVHYSVRRGKR